MQDAGCKPGVRVFQWSGSVFGVRWLALGHEGIRGKGDTTFLHPSSRPGAENRRPDTEFSTRPPAQSSGSCTQVHRPLTVLPYCLLARLPYGRKTPHLLRP